MLLGLHYLDEVLTPDFYDPETTLRVSSFGLENGCRSLSEVFEVCTWTPLCAIEPCLVAGTESLEAIPLTLRH